MKFTLWQSCLLSITLAAAGCTSVDMTEYSPRFVPASSSRKCVPTTTFASNGAIFAEREFLEGTAPPSDLRTSAAYLNVAETFQLHEIKRRMSLALREMPSELENDPVVNAIVDASFIAVQQNLKATSIALNVAPVSAWRSGTKLNSPVFNEQMLKSFAEKIQKEMAAPSPAYNEGPIAAVGPTGAPSRLPSFPEAFRHYFEAYFDGNYRDRLGGEIQKPRFSSRMGNEQVADTVSVFVDLILDYSFYTPVWTDGNGTYYPGATRNIPTVMTSEIIREAEKLVLPGECGISKLKAALIGYMAQMVGHGAVLGGGLDAGTFGGWSVGLGVVGKISIGDNQTLQAMAQAVLERSFARMGEQAAYQALYFVNDRERSTFGTATDHPRQGEVARLVGKYLAPLPRR